MKTQLHHQLRLALCLFAGAAALSLSSCGDGIPSLSVEEALQRIQNYNLLPQGHPLTAEMQGHLNRYLGGDERITDYPYIAAIMQLGDEHNKVPISCIKAFISEGADINKSQPRISMPKGPSLNGGTPLGLAISKKDESIARYLVENNADVNTPSNEESPLLMAIRNKMPQLALLLIEKGAKASDPGALLEAIKSNEMAVVEKMLQSGARLDVKFEDQTPVAQAVIASPEMLQLLLAQENNPVLAEDYSMAIAFSLGSEKKDIAQMLINHPRRQGATLTEEVCSSTLAHVMRREQVDIVNLIYTHFDDKISDEDYTLTLNLAMERQKPQLVEMLLGLDTHKLTGNAQRTLVLTALKENNEDLVRKLVARSAATIAEDACEVLFSHAVTESSPEMVRLLLSHYEINPPKLYGALVSLAALAERPEIVRLLMEHNNRFILMNELLEGLISQNPKLIPSQKIIIEHMPDDYQQEEHVPADYPGTKITPKTLLYAALRQGDIEVFKMLYNKLKPQEKDEELLHNAICDERVEIARFLVEQGYSFNPYNQAMIHAVISSGNVELLKLIMANGTSMKNINSYPNISSLLESILSNGHDDMAEFLLQQGVTHLTLKMAIQNNRDRIVRSFLTRGAKLPPELAMQGIRISIEKSNTQLATLMLGAYPQYMPVAPTTTEVRYADTPEYMALFLIQSGTPEMARFFISKGFKINQFLIDYAMSQQRDDMVKCLAEASDIKPQPAPRTVTTTGCSSTTTATPTQPTPAPATAEAETQPTTQQVSESGSPIEALLTRYIESLGSEANGGRGDLDQMLACFAPQVDYFEEGKVSSAQIRQDNEVYFTKYPQRFFTLESTSVTQASGGESRAEAIVTARLIDAKGKESTRNITYTLRVADSEGALRIVSVHSEATKNVRPKGTTTTNIEAPDMENGLLIELRGTRTVEGTRKDTQYLYVFMQQGRAYAMTTSQALAAKPELVRATDYFRPGGVDRYGRQVWFNKNDSSYTDDSPEGSDYWYVCRSFSYVPKGNKGKLAITFAHERWLDMVCRSAKGAQSYNYDAAPAEFTLTTARDGVYEGSIKGVMGTMSDTEAPEEAEGIMPFELIHIKMSK